MVRRSSYNEGYVLLSKKGTRDCRFIDVSFSALVIKVIHRVQSGPFNWNYRDMADGSL